MAFDALSSRVPEIQSVKNAVLVPFGQGKRRGMRRPAGVFDATGKYVPQSACFRSDVSATTSPPEDDVTVGELPILNGRWLFGGILYQHFGHFLVESTSRLWAADHVDQPIDGVVFFPRKRLSWPNRFIDPVRPLLSKFGEVFEQVHAPVVNTRVEELIVAPQAFGLGEMAAGTPEYRNFVKYKFCADVPAEGAEKVYISRAELFAKRGRYLGEKRIGELLAAEGYRIFHPQQHSIEEQVAQYKAATKIISSDASALHLAGFYLEPSDRVAIVRRREGNAYRVFLQQLASFSGHSPDVIEVLNGDVYSADHGVPRQNAEIYTGIDISALGAALRKTGYIKGEGRWDNLTEDEVASELDSISVSLGGAAVEKLP